MIVAGIIAAAAFGVNLAGAAIGRWVRSRQVHVEQLRPIDRFLAHPPALQPEPSPVKQVAKGFALGALVPSYVIRGTQGSASAPTSRPHPPGYQHHHLEDNVEVWTP